VIIVLVPRVGRSDSGPVSINRIDRGDSMLAHRLCALLNAQRHPGIRCGFDAVFFGTKPITAHGNVK